MNDNSWSTMSPDEGEALAAGMQAGEREARPGYRPYDQNTTYRDLVERTSGQLYQELKDARSLSEAHRALDRAQQRGLAVLEAWLKPYGSPDDVIEDDRDGGPTGGDPSSWPLGYGMA